MCNVDDIHKIIVKWFLTDVLDKEAHPSDY